ncbi:MAG: D-alanine--D-alanine ligase [Bacteroidota bacterium]
MSTDQEKSKYIALQLVGSPTDQFFFDLSLLYAKEVVQPKGFKLLFAVVYPDGKWVVTADLEAMPDKVSLSQMIELVEEVDLVVPHLFCQKGLTSLRIFFEDVLNIPVVGASGHVASMAQDKQLTKVLAEEAGVRVPKGLRLTRQQADHLTNVSLQYPVIVKSNNTDNSNGLSLVQSPSELKAAIDSVLQFDEEVLIEEYIAGREIRAAIIEKDGGFEALPFIEYLVSKKHPIRERTDKYKFDEEGNLLEQSEKQYVPAQCPAEVSKTLQTEIAVMMTKMHERLGCRDFSMYDFRIHEATGQPYLLEAGLFWSFSESSMISTMLKEEGRDLREVTGRIWMNRVR